MKTVTLHLPVLSLLELAYFEEWKKATPKRRAEICRKIGKMEAEQIIKQAKEEAERRFPI